MTETPRDRAVVAAELAALTMLSDKVAEQIKDRRAEVEKWTQGAREMVHLPGNDPNVPTKVAEVRCDGGQKVAAVQDRAAWIEWCKANSAHNVARTAEGRTAWTLDNESTEALAAAVTAAETHLSHDPWAASDPVSMACAALLALEASGYTLTKVQTIPAEDVVMPAWETATLKTSQAAGSPVCPDGQIPDGIGVSTSPGKAYVKVEKPPNLRAQWIRHARERGIVQAALLPAADNG